MNKVLLEYIEKNKKMFIRLLFFIFIGIIVGVIYFNLNLNTNEKEEIKLFINNSHEILKQNEDINSIELLKKSIKNNVSIIICIGLCGFCIFGNVIIYFVLLIKGFSLGFTISSILFTFKMSLNFWIIMFLVMLQNFIIIPSILLLCEKSSKLYKNIINKKVTMKEELCKHIVIMLIVLLLGILASLIEIYISMNFLIVF